MKTKTSQALKNLRKIIGQTQTEFAELIGASKDAVASWEISRNPLSAQFARRISMATGVNAEDLLRGRAPLTTEEPEVGRIPFTAETYARHRKTYWGRSDEAAARQHLKHCADALGLIFQAAAKPEDGPGPSRLPAVLDAFIQWCEQTREDFQLATDIEAQLAQRRFQIGQTHTYAQWRNMAKKSPEALEAVGFQDDPKKHGEELLFVGREAIPGWAPGRSMEGPRPGVTRLLPVKKAED